MDPDQYLVIQSENGSFAAENYRWYSALFSENPEFLANHFSTLAEGWAVRGVTLDHLREMLLHDDFRFIREAEALDTQQIDDIIAASLETLEGHYEGIIAAFRAASPETDELISRSYLISAADKVARDFENGRFNRFFRLVDNDDVSGLRDYFAALQSSGLIRDFIAMNRDNPAFTGDPDALGENRFGLLNYIERNGSDRAAETTSAAIHDYLDYFDYADIRDDMPRIGAELPYREPPRPMPRPVIEAPSEPTEPEEPEVIIPLDYEFGTPLPPADGDGLPESEALRRNREGIRPVIPQNNSLNMDEAKTRLNDVIEKFDALPYSPEERLAAVQDITRELETLAQGLNANIAAAHLGQALPPRQSVTDSELELSRLNDIMQSAQLQSNPGEMATILSDAARQARITLREIQSEILRGAPAEPDTELGEESNLAPSDTGFPALDYDFGAATATRFAQKTPDTAPSSPDPNAPNPVA
jgi:hypothetical protein